MRASRAARVKSGFLAAGCKQGVDQLSLDQLSLDFEFVRRAIRQRVWLGVLLLLACAGSRLALAVAPVYGYKIVAKLPHSTESYTEGFFYKDGLFYEGTGLTGKSELLVWQPETGKVMQRLQLPAKYFGEGIIDWGPNLYEWTWQTHIGFVYDRFSLRKVSEFTYDGEGWGMTRTASAKGGRIITSDGSAILRFRDPDTFKEVRHIVVREGAKTIDQLNELELVKGEIYANIWHSDRIARISPKDGHVIAWIDLAGILPESQRVNEEAVLNGIAYDAVKDRLFVTGKQWPAVFEIRLVPPVAKK
jgi:glutamine cyclotransferase